MGENLAEKLGEVGKILAEEAGLQNKGLAGVVGSQLTTEELGFAGDAEGGALSGVLSAG